MDNRCGACGTYGKRDFKGDFVSDDWIRAAKLQQENTELKAKLAAAEKYALKTARDLANDIADSFHVKRQPGRRIGAMRVVHELDAAIAKEKE